MDDRFHLEDGDLPPPYSASANPDARSHSASLLSSHVAGLRDRISASQAARASARDDRDGYVLSLIVPYLEDFLSSVSEMDPTPRLAEATLVPDAAISEDWKFSDEDEKRGGEFRTLIRVRETQKKKKQADGGAMPSRPEKSSARSAPSDGTGSRPMIPPLWWESENAARRLAKHLQPERPAAAKSAPMLRDGDCGASSNKKSGLWGLFKKSDKAAQQVVPPTTEGSGDGVTMTARAEEVTFRRENELGIWETMTGWGIVVRVRIQST